MKRFASFLPSLAREKILAREEISCASRLPSSFWPRRCHSADVLRDRKGRPASKARQDHPALRPERRCRPGRTARPTRPRRRHRAACAAPGLRRQQQLRPDLQPGRTHGVGHLPRWRNFDHTECRYRFGDLQQQPRTGTGAVHEAVMLFLLPACGEKVGMRGHLRWAQTSGAQNRGEAPSPSSLRSSTSPRTRGEVK